MEENRFQVKVANQKNSNHQKIINSVINAVESLGITDGPSNIDLILDKIKNRYGVTLLKDKPKVPY